MTLREAQMSLIDDTTEVLKFLELARDKRWITDDAMHSRSTACKKMFSLLEEDERNAEYVLSNLQLIADRYVERQPTVRKDTLKVYKSRLKSTLEDFLGWNQDPIGWEIALAQKKKSRAEMKRKPMRKAARSMVVPNEVMTEGRRVSLPIRPDFDIELVLPSDGLTAKELLRLELLLYSYCNDLEKRDLH